MFMKKIVFTVISLLAVSHANAEHFQLSPYLSTLENQDASIIKMWKENAPIPLERLVQVQFSYIDFDENSHHDGELIVLDAVAEHVLNIMKTLYSRKFPIASAKRIERFQADDDISMGENNSSCFNCRLSAEKSGLPSIHAYGLAIDINPIQNPFVFFDSDTDREKGLRTVTPSKGSEIYINRHRAQKDKLTGLAEDIVDVFFSHGFHVWGGNWNDPIDWQHFQPSRAMAQILAVMTPHHAKIFFDMHVRSLSKNSENFMTELGTNNDLVALYQMNPDKFMAVIQNHKNLLDSTDTENVMEVFKKAVS